MALATNPAFALADEELALAPSSVPVERIVEGGPPKDAIAAIMTPRFVAAARAAFLPSEDHVIGILAGHTAKAYPLRILNWHQVVNDEIDGTPIAITYCPLSGSAVVFDRRVGGEVLTFGVSGRLYQGNVLLFDHQSSSLWSQLAGVALTGERMGAHLEEVAAVLTTWGDWLREHPATIVLSPDSSHARDYTLNPYVAYQASDTPVFHAREPDTRLAEKERVLGVMVGGRARAYPYSELERAASPIRDKVGRERVVVSFDGTNAVARQRRELLPATPVYWFAWAAFHPATGIWRAPRYEPLAGPVRNTDITIQETKSYWTQLPCTLTADPDHADVANTGLFVISGRLKNASDLPLHHIRLQFDLLDHGGKVVFHEEGFNRAAESLMELEEGAIASGEPEEIREIPPGGSDTFRMIMIGEEIPPFDHPDVSVVSAR